MKLLSLAKDAYNKDAGKEPIRQSDYSAYLGAFEHIVQVLNISDAYDSDFRRNLPAGGWRGLREAPTLIDRIADVREFLRSNAVYSPTGAAILDNLCACVHISEQQDVDVRSILVSLESTLARAARNDLR